MTDQVASHVLTRLPLKNKNTTNGLEKKKIRSPTSSPSNNNKNSKFKTRNCPCLRGQGTEPCMLRIEDEGYSSTRPGAVGSLGFLAIFFL
mmetsp:Transcript_21747/g.47363  ORF Transcript_21747/g.47363 Transcript_21747/m.47363 type:complete len:90 (-) Transcript_21747:1081-1350(-)